MLNKKEKAVMKSIYYNSVDKNVVSDKQKKYAIYSQYHDYEIYNLSLLCHPCALL